MGVHAQGVRAVLLEQVQDRGAEADAAVLGQQLLLAGGEEVERGEQGGLQAWFRSIRVGSHLQGLSNINVELKRETLLCK